MTGILVRAAGLLAVYLLVLTSVSPGDVLVGGVLALAVASVVRPLRRPPADSRSRRTAQSALARFTAAGAVLAQTAREMVLGSWRVARFCLGAASDPGFVEIPRGDRSRRNVALWGVLTGEAPDEIVVDVDETRDVLIVHLVDAGDPDAIRARHQQAYERWQRRVVP